MDIEIKKNYILNVSNQILSLIIPMITAPYIARVIGADGIGLYSYCDSIVSYFVLFASLGLPLYGQKEVSYLQNDRFGRSKVFWETFIIGFVSTALAFVFFIFFTRDSNNRILFCILSVNILSCGIDISWLFQGMENFKTISVRNFLFRLFNVVYVFLFVRKKEDLLVYVAGICCFSFANYASLWFSLRKVISFVPFKELRPFKRIPGIISLFVPTVAIQVYTMLDKTMIGIITNDVFQNGYYEQAIKLSKMVLTLVTSLGAVMLSRIGSYHSCGDEGKVKKALYNSYRFVWFLSIPLGFGLSSIASNFVPWFYGDGYGEVVPLLFILSFLIIAIGVSNVTGIQYLIPMGKQKQYTVSVIVGACSNFVLNVFLIPRFLSFGAAIASLIAETLVTATQLFLVRRELSVSRILKSSWKYLTSGIIMFVSVRLEGVILEPSAWNTAVMVFSGMTVYFLALFVLRDGFLKELFSKEKDCV